MHIAAVFLLLLMPILSPLASAILVISAADAIARQSPETAVIWLIDGNRVSPPTSYQTEQDADQETALKKYLGDRGYLSSTIDSIEYDSISGRQILYASSGCRHYIRTIRRTTSADGPSSIHVAYSGIIRQGDPFSFDLVQLEMTSISEFYSNMGYLLVSVGLKEVDLPEPCQVDIHIETRTGDLVKLSGQLFPTVKHNNPEYLSRITLLADSAVADRRTLRQVRRNLQQSGLFERVDEPDLLLQDGRYYLVHNLRERRTNAIDLLLGYVPDPGGGGDVVGTGTLRIRNAIWDGSMLFLRFERMSPLVTRFQGEFQQRWIFGIPLSAGGAFRFIQQDTTYQLRNLRVESGYSIGGGMEIFGSVRREASSSNKSPGVPVRILDGAVAFAGLGVRADTRNDLMVPTTGIEFYLELQTGRKRISDDRAALYTERLNYRQQELFGYFRPNYMLFRRQVLAPSITGFLKTSPEYTESDLFRTGGARSIRGYREDQFLLSRLIWGDLEYRYLLDETSYAFIFYTFGLYHRPQLIVEATRASEVTGRILSGGFGFSYRTPIGQVQFSYAISADDALTNGKVHFGLITDL